MAASLSVTCTYYVSYNGVLCNCTYYSSYNGNDSYVDTWANSWIASQICTLRIVNCAVCELSRQSMIRRAKHRSMLCAPQSVQIHALRPTYTHISAYLSSCKLARRARRHHMMWSSIGRSTGAPLSTRHSNICKLTYTM